MRLFNKKIKLVIVVSLAGLLLSLHFLISISQYCCCDPASLQLEISSISDCSDMDICNSDHSQKEHPQDNQQYYNVDGREISYCASIEILRGAFSERNQQASMYSGRYGSFKVA